MVGHLGLQDGHDRCHRRHGLPCLHILQRKFFATLSPVSFTDADLRPAPQLCGTNIGATILLARVLQDWISSSAAGSTNPRTRDGAIFALAVGSNYGAFTLTFSASLAGLLWRQILREKGIHVRARQFLLLNAPIAAVAMTASSVVLVGQVYIVHRDG